MADNDIEPFTISIPDEALQDLQTRLSLARFPDEIEAAEWDYGAPLADIKRLTSYWKDKYDWRAAERKLNTLPQYRTTIQVDGFEPLKLHFIHQRSVVAKAIPLLFVHGWPGCFIEATKIWEQLPSPEVGSGAPAFHFVALSLPNFGFSEGSKRKGFALAQYAETCHMLMQKLGYDQYVTQGGDWGYYITRAMALRFPAHVRAIHVNMDHGAAPAWMEHPLLALQHSLTPYNSVERAGLARTQWFMEQSSGYRALQTTKPQTLGYGVADSPVGLLAWIYEKLHDWTDAYPWTDDEVCTWISVFWFSTAGPAANLRIYYEVAHEWDNPATRVTRERTTEYIGGVKMGMAHSPKELRVLPSSWTRTRGDIVFERTHNGGGHFFAYERPENLIADVRDMFGKGGGAAGVIEQLDGY